jgi:hypothetical protein
MIFNALTAAYLLLSGIASPATELRMNVEQVSFMTSSSETSFLSMTSATRTKLIEKHAAPHWGLTVQQAWILYNDGAIKIVEVVPDEIYRIEYEGILEVLLNEND